MTVDPWILLAIGAVFLIGAVSIVSMVVRERRRRLRRRRQLEQAQLLEPGSFDQDMKDLDGAFLDDDYGGF